ncbi:MAG: proteasome ATPase [Ruaniaceae bacterium]|nr:proteasome ATPase [Ruaniaceae bacterium]
MTHEELVRKNDRLASALRATRQELATVQEQVRQLSTTPNTFGVIVRVNLQARTADVLMSGRKVRCAISEAVAAASLFPGREVILNDHMSIVSTSDFDDIGDIVPVTDFLPHGRIAVQVRDGEERVVRLAESLLDPAGNAKVRPGDLVRADLRGGFAYEAIERADTEELMLEEVPDVSYADIGGLGPQIAQIKDSIELPFLHPDHYRAHRLNPPRGVMLYGPPGCGKTLIAKAVATSLAQSAAELNPGAEARSYFISVKGPELLTKYVGETERQIRKIFYRARQRARAGLPVVVFFDEMDSLFRTRGTGRSSDVETTVVPQLLAEIDGVESLGNVVVIGATNREDMIDPAIVRPGRLDVKIRISRPDRGGAADILSKYLIPELPLDGDEVAAAGSRESAVAALIEGVVDALYTESPETVYVEATYDSGETEIFHVHSFASGAMLANIIDRAKKYSIKDQLRGLPGGISRAHLARAVAAEIRENADLPSAGSPDEWARVSGRRGARITHLRTLR